MNFRTVMQYAARYMPRDAYRELGYVLSPRSYVFVRASLVSLLRRIHHVGKGQRAGGRGEEGQGVCDTYKRVREEITMRGL